jgi:TatD DNase family protein
MKEPEYIDIHSHLNDPAFEKDPEEVIGRMEEAGVSTLVVGTDKKMSEEAVRLAGQYPSIHALVGLHPTDTDENFDNFFYEDLLSRPKVVGVGECGLDYFHLKGETEEEKRNEKREQMEKFEAQVELAAEAEKPLMVHCRGAHEDLLPVLKEKKNRYGDALFGDVHFFTADKETAEAYFALNFTISFTGVLTFTADYDEVVKDAPLSMIQAETDAPYVAPVPHRGKRCEPAWVVNVVERIAEIRGEDLETVKNALRENTRRVFNI